MKRTTVLTLVALLTLAVAANAQRQKSVQGQPAPAQTNAPKPPPAPASVLDTLADKAGLVPRGDAYVRRRDTSTTTISTQPGSPD